MSEAERVTVTLTVDATRLRELLDQAVAVLGDPDASGYDRTRLADEIRDALEDQS